MRILLGILILGMASIACSQTAKQPFTLTISADKPVFRAGEDVGIDVVITNVSNHDIDCTINGINALAGGPGLDFQTGETTNINRRVF